MQPLVAAGTEPPLSADRAPEPERRLVLLAIAGDAAAFEGLVVRHQRWLHALMWRQCGDAALAADLAQMAFLKAWRQIGGLRSPEAFRAWLRRIAQNLLVDAMRRGGVARGDASGGVGQFDSHPPHETDVLATVDLQRAVARLTFAQRSCIVLAYGEGLGHGEIAELLSLPLGTVKSHINRGLAALRVILGPGKFDEP